MENPIAIFTAGDNSEAQLVRVLLEQEGIEAKAVDDLSPVGLSIFGPLAGIYQPKIFVDRSQAEQAAAIVRQYVERLQQERGVSKSARREKADVEATCEKCGKITKFKGSQQGTIQECRHCGAYLDVGQPPPEVDAAEGQ